MKNLPHSDPVWPDVYDHCHKCKQVAVKNEMVEIATNERLCVECAANRIQEQDQTIKGLAKSYADINAVNGCLEKKNDELRAALHTIERDNDEQAEAENQRLIKENVDLKKRVEYLERTIRLAYVAIQ